MPFTKAMNDAGSKEYLPAVEYVADLGCTECKESQSWHLEFHLVLLARAI